MEAQKVVFALALIFSYSSVNCYPFYGDLIPNGQNVLHPCTGEPWTGVGHVGASGGGLRNPFGEDFAVQGRTWNEAFCRTDSDQDGKTNGEELGDPDCVWQTGQIPRGNSTSHPGICEPVESPECQAIQGVTCGDVEPPYNCPANSQPDVMSMDLRFPVSQVPARETNYFCKSFKVPNDQPYHMISWEPIIDNINVLHHILLFGCDEEIEDDGIVECGMVDQRCRSLIGAWTLGVDGYCLREDVGVSIGRGSFPSVSIQVHWNNPQRLPDYTDSSGLRLFYTAQLRRFSERIAIMGQRSFSVPPMTEETIVEGHCTAACTELLPTSINVSSALLHMHYLGIDGNVEVYRDGKLLTKLVNDGYYDYESPSHILFDPPITIHPGDELITKCVYNSKDGQRERSTTTYFGQATEDEMCFSFISFYFVDPDIEAGFNCLKQGPRDLCNVNIVDPEDCDVCDFYMIALDINQQLVESGRCSQTCNEGCSEMVSLQLLTSPCAQEVIAHLQAGGPVPDAFRAVADAYRLCLSSPQYSSTALSHQTNFTPRNDIPSPETCGIPGESVAPGLGGSIVFAAVIAALSMYAN